MVLTILMTMVMRMASGKDGLWDENVGPSMYAKAQGRPIKVWGFLANGRLEYYVLPMDPENSKKTTHMNGNRYHWLVTTKFSNWRKRCFPDGKPVSLVQDHERCLWQDRNLNALRAAKCPIVDKYPKHSPDLNAIEGCWKILRDRLQATEPKTFESRAAFLVRLRRTVVWLNDNNGEHIRKLCTNQRERALDVKLVTGAKTKW